MRVPGFRISRVRGLTYKEAAVYTVLYNMRRRLQNILYIHIYIYIYLYIVIHILEDCQVYYRTRGADSIPGGIFGTSLESMKSSSKTSPRAPSNGVLNFGRWLEGPWRCLGLNSRNSKLNS